jgi:putative SOS response-associated peptidase YedK
MDRWGMPTTPVYLKGLNADPGITSIRNPDSPHWRRWLGIENRCVVSFTSVAENEHSPDGSKRNVWFAFDDSRPLGVFAGDLDPMDLRA